MLKNTETAYGIVAKAFTLVTVPDVRLYDRGRHPARGHAQGYGGDQGRGRT